MVGENRIIMYIMYQNWGFVVAFHGLDIIDLGQNGNENGIS